MIKILYQLLFPFSMISFTDPKPLEYDPDFEELKKAELEKLEEHIMPGFDANSDEALEYTSTVVDPPMVDISECFAFLDHSYPIQSCYGHFTCSGYINLKNTRRLSSFSRDVSRFMYREAYFILAVRNNDKGKMLIDDLAQVERFDREYIHFGSREDLWADYKNSYAVVVGPSRNLDGKIIRVSRAEAFHIERMRDVMMLNLRAICEKHRELYL